MLKDLMHAIFNEDVEEDDEEEVVEEPAKQEAYENQNDSYGISSFALFDKL